MLDMNKDRISKIKCYFCGKREKKVVVCINNMDKKVCKHLVCCGCGNVATFVENDSMIQPTLMNNYKIYGAYCGKGSNCTNTNCQFNENKKEPPVIKHQQIPVKTDNVKSVYKDNIERKI